MYLLWWFSLCRLLHKVMRRQFKISNERMFIWCYVQTKKKQFLLPFYSCDIWVTVRRCVVERFCYVKPALPTHSEHYQKQKKVVRCITARDIGKQCLVDAEYSVGQLETNCGIQWCVINLLFNQNLCCFEIDEWTEATRNLQWFCLWLCFSRKKKHYCLSHCLFWTSAVDAWNVSIPVSNCQSMCKCTTVVDTKSCRILCRCTVLFLWHEQQMYSSHVTWIVLLNISYFLKCVSKFDRYSETC